MHIELSIDITWRKRSTILNGDGTQSGGTSCIDPLQDCPASNGDGAVCISVSRDQQSPGGDSRVTAEGAYRTEGSRSCSGHGQTADSADDSTERCIFGSSNRQRIPGIGDDSGASDVSRGRSEGLGCPQGNGNRDGLCRSRVIHDAGCSIGDGPTTQRIAGGDRITESDPSKASHLIIGD